MAVISCGDKKVEAKGIIFDKDGTLIEFHSMWLKVAHMWVDGMLAQCGLAPAAKDFIFRSVGIEPKTETVHPRGPYAMGPWVDTALAAATALFMHGIPWDEAKRISMEGFQECVKPENLPKLITPVQGIRQTLEKLHAAGIKIVVASSDTNERVALNLELLGVSDLVDLILGFDDVKRPKPDPEMIEAACKRLRISPQEVIFVGDTVTDMLTGKNAGAALTVGVLTGVSDRDTLLEHADVVCASIAEIDALESGEALYGYDHLTIHTDGASRGNPGEAGIGVVIYHDGSIVKEIARYIGKATNNEAEYRALIAGLEEAISLGGRVIEVFADSELVVKQVNGEYRVKNEGLLSLYERVKTLINKFEQFKIKHVGREQNKNADALANRGIDKMITD